RRHRAERHQSHLRPQRPRLRAAPGRRELPEPDPPGGDVGAPAPGSETRDGEQAQAGKAAGSQDPKTVRPVEAPAAISPIAPPQTGAIEARSVETGPFPPPPAAAETAPAAWCTLEALSGCGFSASPAERARASWTDDRRRQRPPVVATLRGSPRVPDARWRRARPWHDDRCLGSARQRPRHRRREDRSDVVPSPRVDVRRAVGEGDKRVGFAYQDAQRGTGHAVLSAESQLTGYEGDLLILNGDLPALLPETLKTFVEFYRASGAPLGLLTAVLKEPQGYGRVIRT